MVMTGSQLEFLDFQRLHFGERITVSFQLAQLLVLGTEHSAIFIVGKFSGVALRSDCFQVIFSASL